MSDIPRVLYLSPSMTMGGAERHLSQLLNAHSQQVEQHLALIYPLSQDPYFYREDVEASGVPVTFFNKRPGKIGRPMLALRYARLLSTFQPDIVHAYQWHAMDIMRAFHRIAPLPRPLLIVNPQLRLIEPEYIAAERRYIQQTDHIIAIASVIAEEYRAAVPESANRITVIYNGVDARYFSPGDRRSARAQIPLDLPPEATLLLYMGRIAERKNLDTLLRAMAILRHQGRWPEDAHLLCVGRAVRPEYAARLRRTVESEGLTDHVTFLDETLDVRLFYQASDVLVLPSHYEGQGLVILEAAFCARPALISDAVNRAHLVKDGETGWITPADSATQMAETLAQVLNTPRADRDRMGAAARDFLLPEYRAEVMAERYLSLYNHLIESKKR